MLIEVVSKDAWGKAFLTRRCLQRAETLSSFAFNKSKTVPTRIFLSRVSSAPVRFRHAHFRPSEQGKGVVL